MRNEDFMNRWGHYEAEGAAAAHEGKTREDCPYTKHLPAQADAWNFWVYGNENEQGKLISEFMRAEGTPSFYMTTAPLTPEVEAAMMEYQAKCTDAERRMRSAKGWKLRDG
jgi:hypothetical protein